MKISLAAILIFCSVQVFSQGFDASIIGGFNASQINGDDLAGYNKLGLHGGLKVGYLIKPKLHLATELLYSQRGSSSRVSFGSPVEEVSINLSYFDMPVTVSFLDWYVEDSYYKVRADFGLSYGYLFQASAQNSFFEDDVEQFSNHDLSFLAGIAYIIQTCLSEHFMDISLLFDLNIIYDQVYVSRLLLRFTDDSFVQTIDNDRGPCG